MKSGCHHHQIGMDYPLGRHFQNGRHTDWWNYMFTNNSVSRIDRDRMLVCKPIFMWMGNPMITLTNIYDSWLTGNYNGCLRNQQKSLKLVNGPNIPARNIRHLCYFVTGTYPNTKKSIGMNYLYSVIFKMAASEVKLRFHLILRI